MGTASMVLGIISIIMSFIPGIGMFFAITAIIAIILGIVSLCKKEAKGKSIAGIITSVIAIIIMIIYAFVLGAIINSGIIDEAVREAERKSNQYSQSNDNNNAITNQVTDKQYIVGETYKDSDIAINFLSADENFTAYNKYATVKEGYKVIKADFEFENVGTKTQYVSSYDFQCFADGYDSDSFWSVENSSFSSNLSAGKKIKGSVYFQVPANSSQITLEYDIDSYYDQIATFKVK